MKHANEIENLRKLVNELKQLKKFRRALTKAEKEGRASDAADIIYELAELENLFRENHPELDIDTDGLLNAALRVANSDLKLLTTPAVEKKKRGSKAMDTCDLMLAHCDDDAATQKTTTKKRPATARRRPMMAQNKA